MTKTLEEKIAELEGFDEIASLLVGFDPSSANHLNHEEMRKRMLQVIRELKAKCDEQERLLDEAILCLAWYADRVVASGEHAAQTLTQLQARDK